MKSSQQWLEHFQLNLTRNRINWEQPPQITPTEIHRIRYGLRAWQKGETSDGSHLKQAAAKFARHFNDPDSFSAIELFIREEQKHGANLGRYIDLIGERRIRFDLGDYLFRRIRGMNRSMEAWTVTVIIVESAAQIFYRALKNATGCPLLKEICTDILIDEAYHIQFQKERLARIMDEKRFLNFHASMAAYFIFFKTTARVIWLAHHRAFQAGGISRAKFLSLMQHKIQKVLDIPYRRDSPAAIAQAIS